MTVIQELWKTNKRNRQIPCELEELLRRLDEPKDQAKGTK